MEIHEIRLTKAHWRQLHLELRRELCQILGGTSAILGRQVLDVARTPCAKGAYLLTWHLYHGLDGEPFTPYRGSELGLLMDLRAQMGEDPAETGASILV